MRIEEVIWLDAIVDKLAVKHGVETEEVEEVLNNNPVFASWKAAHALAKMFIWHQAKPMEDSTYRFFSFTKPRAMR